jgi:hypothetical protein
MVRAGNAIPPPPPTHFSLKGVWPFGGSTKKSSPRPRMGKAALQLSGGRLRVKDQQCYCLHNLVGRQRASDVIRMLPSAGSRLGQRATLAWGCFPWQFAPAPAENLEHLSPTGPRSTTAIPSRRPRACRIVGSKRGCRRAPRRRGAAGQNDHETAAA